MALMILDRRLEPPPPPPPQERIWRWNIWFLLAMSICSFRKFGCRLFELMFLAWKISWCVLLYLSLDIWMLGNCLWSIAFQSWPKILQPRGWDHSLRYDAMLKCWPNMMEVPSERRDDTPSVALENDGLRHLSKVSNAWCLCSFCLQTFI